jgi:hypothetical protein
MRAGLVPASVVMIAVALFRPLVVWARNPWDLAAPQELFLYSVVLLAIQTAVFYAAFTLRANIMSATVLAAGSTFVVIQWHQLGFIPPWSWLIVVVGLAAVSHLHGNTRWISYVAWVAAAVLVLAPAIQVGVAHVQRADPYPIVELAPRAPVEATGNVEDVLVLIVDSYPSFQVARDWFGHDTTDLASALTTHGFVVQDTGWSHNTFTGLAVPGLLELKPIVEAGETRPWGNRRSTYELVRGESLVAASLQFAGFSYTHIESGWEGAHCGDAVDTCMPAPWFRETSWSLLESSLLREWLLDRYGNFSVPGTEQAVSHLKDLKDRFDDGKKDFIFAHLLLPHVPIVVDENCEVKGGNGEDRGILDPQLAEPESVITFTSHLACVDSLLGDVVEVIGDRTAAIITGDHGTGSNGQISRPPNAWSDADIAERLGVLLAYKLPQGCNARETDSNIEAMRMIMGCATHIELPSNHGKYLIGAQDPVWVDPARMDSIKDRVAQGSIRPEGS